MFLIGKKKLEKWRINASWAFREGLKGGVWLGRVDRIVRESLLLPPPPSPKPCRDKAVGIRNSIRLVCSEWDKCVTSLRKIFFVYEKDPRTETFLGLKVLVGDNEFSVVMEQCLIWMISLNDGQNVRFSSIADLHLISIRVDGFDSFDFGSLESARDSLVSVWVTQHRRRTRTVLPKNALASLSKLRSLVLHNVHVEDNLDLPCSIINNGFVSIKNDGAIEPLSPERHLREEIASLKAQLELCNRKLAAIEEITERVPEITDYVRPSYRHSDFPVFREDVIALCGSLSKAKSRKRITVYPSGTKPPRGYKTWRNFSDWFLSMRDAGKDITCAEIEVFVIPDTDKRVSMRGQKGIKAKGDIHENTLIGVYSCEVLLEKNLVTDENDAAKTFYLQSYSMMFNHSICGEALAGDGREVGNIMRFVNDPRDNPFGPSQSRDSGLNRENTIFVEVVIEGLPHMFFLTSKKIDAGEELLADYGSHYWDSIKPNYDECEKNKGAARSLTEINSIVKQRNNKHPKS